MVYLNDDGGRPDVHSLGDCGNEVLIQVDGGYKEPSPSNYWMEIMRLFSILFLIFCALAILGGCMHQKPRQQSAAKAILGSSVPAHNVRDFGAIGDGTSLDTRAVQAAVDRAAADGGGCVYFPAGDYLCGTVRLRNHVSLYLENGCTVWGSKNLDDYDADKPHLFYATDARDLVICGDGEINGNGPSFWDNGRLQRWLDKEIDLPRTKDMIRFDRCHNIRLENVQINYGAFWNVGFEDCEQIAIRGISMRNGVYEEDGPNTDGFNLWNCRRVRISDCDLITGDDCIALVGDNRDVAITNCNLQSSETALMISGVRNLSISNCTIRDSGCGIGFRIWNEIVVDGVVIENIVMHTTERFQGGGTAIYIWSFPLYVETEIPADTDLPPPGVLKNVLISNVIATANGLVCVNGARDGYVKGLTLDNIRFTMFGGKISEFNAAPPYPYPIYGFHHGSPYGMFFRHVHDLTLRDIRVDWNQPEQSQWGSALRCWNVNNLEIEGFVGRQSAGSIEPAIGLKDVDGAFIRHCRAPAGTGTFVELTGSTQGVSIVGNDLRRARSAVANRTDEQPLLLDNNQLPETD